MVLVGAAQLSLKAHRLRPRARAPACIYHILGQTFYFLGYFVCFLLVASLFDEEGLPPSNTTAHWQVPDSSNGGTNTGATKIAYAVTLTGCGAFFNQSVADPNASPFRIPEGAAVLAHSIYLSSIRNPAPESRYDYELIALYHPDAAPCVGVLEDLGYKLIERDTFVKVDEIQGEFLRETISTSGCCGEKELIKFEAFTLVEYPLVLLLDLDCLLLKPLDTLFNFMLEGVKPPSDHLRQSNQIIPPTVDFLYTLDYAMVAPSRKIKPVQGGFLLLRPSMAVYAEFQAIAKAGDYRKHGGWGGKTGKYWGGHTVQGMLPYYYLVLHRGNQSTSLELNQCFFNNMVARSRGGENTNFKCFSNEEPCPNCQIQPIQDVYSTHFTNCLKPWHCQRHHAKVPMAPLCRKLHHAWFRIRADMEYHWGRNATGPARPWIDRDHFFGYCKSAGEKGYIPIQPPYGNSKAFA